MEKHYFQSQELLTCLGEICKLYEIDAYDIEEKF